MVPRSVRTVTASPRCSRSRSSSAPPPVCTVCPVTRALPRAAPGRAPPAHHPSRCGSLGGTRVPPGAATGTTGARTPRRGITTRRGAPGSHRAGVASRVVPVPGVAEPDTAGAVARAVVPAPGAWPNQAIAPTRTRTAPAAASHQWWRPRPATVGVLPADVDTRPAARDEGGRREQRTETDHQDRQRRAHEVQDRPRAALPRVHRGRNLAPGGLGGGHVGGHAV